MQLLSKIVSLSVFACLSLTLSVAPKAQAQSWTPIIDDNFDRPNTILGSAANSQNVTGPTGAPSQTYVSPSVGSPYIDALGSIYTITNGTLCQSTAAAGASPTHKITRPAIESALFAQEKITTAPIVKPTEDYYLLLHEQPTNTGLYCLASFHGAGSAIALGWHTYGGYARIAAVSFKCITSHSYIITFNATSGGTTKSNCLMSASVADAAAPDVVVATITATNTASNDTNLSGTFGFCTSGTNSVSGVTRWQTFQQPAMALTMAPTSIEVNAVSTVNVTLTGGSPYSTHPSSPQFSLAGSNPGTTPASIVSQTITSPTTASLVIAAGNSVQTLTITDLVNSIFTTISVVAPTGQPPTTGSIALVSSSPTTNVVSMTPTYGGSPPYTLKLYRVEATPGNVGFAPPAAGTIAAVVSGVGAGIVPSNLIDTTVTAGHTYIYRVLVTDSFTTPRSAATLPLYVKVWHAPIQLLFIGDSITGYGDGAGNTPASTTAAIIGKQSRRIVKSVVKNVVGSKASQWVSGSDYLEAAKLAANTAYGNPNRVTNPVYVFCMLGTNDHIASVSAPDFLASIASMDADLVAGGYTIIHNQSPHSANESEAQDKLELGYQQDILSLVNGSTIWLGDTTAWTYFAQHPEEFDNSVLHPNAAGVQTYGQLWAGTFLRNILTPEDPAP